MAKFKMGGSGPDGRGLGWIAGLEAKRRFDRSGEIYETDDPNEIRVLRWCPYVEEIADKAAGPEQAGKATPRCRYGRAREVLGCKKMRELIRIGRGLYRVGMTKAELIDRILAECDVVPTVGL